MLKEEHLLLRDALRVVNRFKDHLREAFQLRGVA